MRSSFAEPAASLGRLHLRRVAVAVRREPVAAPAATGTPWSRLLWGEFLPDRRRASRARPAGTAERRRGPAPPPA